MYMMSTIPITLGLLLITVSQVLSLKCIVCEGTQPFSKCESDKRAPTTCPPVYPYCSIETRRAKGKINLIRRQCSNGNLTLTHSPKMKLLNPKTNVTICVFKYVMICASLCDKDSCNGIPNQATIFRGDSKFFRFSVFLTVLLTFDFTQLPHIN